MLRVILIATVIPLVATLGLATVKQPTENFPTYQTHKWTPVNDFILVTNPTATLTYSGHDIARVVAVRPQEITKYRVSGAALNWSEGDRTAFLQEGDLVMLGPNACSNTLDLTRLTPDFVSDDHCVVTIDDLLGKVTLSGASDTVLRPLP
eukprot:TRINITY_DN18702_c0_g1_i1.p1 TRINITY_DN18702_c0_g1~~TRINITY_DN18702_c0_g1_i1.p1  ORF type:complete len:150 (-),score=19.65 TRINITY_DN18702_c0_g1_i1:142-591(-)